MAAQTVADVMTADVASVSTADFVRRAAQLMYDKNVGDVLVLAADQLAGVLTDRDVVVRVVAEGLDPDLTPVGEVCSSDVVEVRPDTPLDSAIDMMRSAAIRRLPVVDSGRLVGVVSLGDLASETDEDSALGQISQAPPNR
jgi:CBS domain-containing protein